jgi:hypothetical protein
MKKKTTEITLLFLELFLHFHLYLGDFLCGQLHECSKVNRLVATPEITEAPIFAFETWG